MTGRQLALDLGVAPRYAREDFIVASSNVQAFRLIEAWPQWPDAVLTLIGPGGSGKSHLASIWAERAGASFCLASSLTPGATERVLETHAAVIEDADCFPFDETELFHLLNRARAERGFVVLTARTPPDAWRLALPDLVSRLRQALCASLGWPDDELMRAILVKLFADRQIPVETAVIDYLALRLDRSFEMARRAVDCLDREALARSRRVTRPLAAEVLAEIAPGEAAEDGRVSQAADQTRGGLWSW